MIARVAASMYLLVIACGPARVSPETPEGETRGASAADSGITRANTDTSQLHRIIPLRSMTSDVEILYGDPAAPGQPFVIRIRELPGTRIPLHSHPVDEHITVVEGTWYFAVGETWDSAALQPLTPGTYAFAPAGSTMFGYSPEAAVVQVHGIGPFHIHWREGMATLDDAGGSARFRFRKGEQVRSPRGRGQIRQGYASGAIVQYEIETEDGRLFMVAEAELSGP